MVKVEFYVYEWFNLDTGYVFYVGKGKDERYKSLRNRNKYFLNYYNKHPCKSRIIQSDLSEDAAYALEKETIAKYRELGQCNTNIADGGAGGIRLFGELNPMYGRTWWDENTPVEKIEKWKKKVVHCGKDNPMFGVSPKERMSEHTYRIWKEKLYRRKLGKSNPNYGNKKLSQYYKNHPDIAKQKQGRPGVKNGRCIHVKLMDKDRNIIKEFDYISQCAKYFKSLIKSEAKINSIAISIGQHIKTKTSYKGYFFE